MHHSHHADLLESFTNPTSSALPSEDIYLPPHLQPVNPEDEDDVVPDQHAAFGIQRATQGTKGDVDPAERNNNRVNTWDPKPYCRLVPKLFEHLLESCRAR